MMNYQICIGLKLDNFPTRVLNSIEFDSLQSKLSALHAIALKNVWERQAALRLVLADVCCRLLAPSMIPRSDLPLWLARVESAMRLHENFVKGTPYLFSLEKRSREHVCRSFKQWLKMSPGKFVNRQRINYAASLLCYSDKTIKEIAIESGFTRGSYFGRVFKNILGQSPQEYRRSSQ